MLRIFLNLIFPYIICLASLVSCGHESKKKHLDDTPQNQEQSQELTLNNISFNNNVKDPIRGDIVSGVIVSSSHKISEDELKSNVTISIKDTKIDFNVKEIGSNVYLFSPIHPISAGDRVTFRVAAPLKSSDGLHLSSKFAREAIWPQDGEIYRLYGKRLP